MNKYSVNIEREEESSNITNINISIRLDKTRDIFPSVTRAATSVTAATSASLERMNSKELVRFRLNSGCQPCAEVRSLQQ